MKEELGELVVWREEKEWKEGDTKEEKWKWREKEEKGKGGKRVK